jgi:hypothetical protein
VRNAKRLDAPADGTELSQSFATDLRKFAASILFPDAGKRVRYRFVRNFRNFRSLPEKCFQSFFFLGSERLPPCQSPCESCETRARPRRPAAVVRPALNQGRGRGGLRRPHRGALPPHGSVTARLSTGARGLRWSPWRWRSTWLHARHRGGSSEPAGRSNHPNQLHDHGLRLAKATSRTLFLVM